ncbi:MAG: hypothetical protein AAGK14_00825 [Verrucomicrobiota bacterium]
MSRNRVKHSQSLQWMVVVKYVLIVGLMSVLGLSYILCKNQIMRLAADTAEKEKELAGLVERNKRLFADINRLKAPRELQRRVREANLVQVVELPHVRRDTGAGASLAQTYSPNLRPAAQ